MNEKRVFCMRVLSILLVAFFLSSCAAVMPFVAPWMTVEGVSLLTTEKAVEDHIFSAYSGKDCSAIRVERGETYCREDELNPTPVVHCYRTLGDVTCYEKPNPSYQDDSKVGHPRTLVSPPGASR